MNHLKKSCICRITLILYLFVIAIVPLTNMHVEKCNESQEFTALHNPDLSTDDIIQVLHEILFSHFYKKVNYSSSMFSHAKMFLKTARTNISAKAHCDGNTGTEPSAVNLHKNASRHPDVDDSAPKLFSGFSSFFSGSSPPLC